MKRWNRFAALLLACLLAACGTVGRDFDPALAESVQNGKTTKQDVRSMFGTPFKTGIQNGDEVWVYERNVYTAIGQDTSKDFIVVFNKQGVVTSHQFMSSEAPK